jgi:hypothetical protein
MEAKIIIFYKLQKIKKNFLFLPLKKKNALYKKFSLRKKKKKSYQKHFEIS